MGIVFFILILLAGCQPKNPSDKIFSYSFPTSSDSLFSFDKLKKNKATAIVFLSPECPLCQSYSLTLNSIYNRFKKDRIEVLGVVPGNDFNNKQINSFVDSFQIKFPLILDKENLFMKKFNATTTPEVFLVNYDLEVLYKGRIDNWAYAIGQKRSVITEHDLIDAIESVQNNTPIKVKKTEAIGCLIE